MTVRSSERTRLKRIVKSIERGEDGELNITGGSALGESQSSHSSSRVNSSSDESVNLRSGQDT